MSADEQDLHYTQAHTFIINEIKANRIEKEKTFLTEENGYSDKLYMQMDKKTPFTYILDEERQEIVRMNYREGVETPQLDIFKTGALNNRRFSVSPNQYFIRFPDTEKFLVVGIDNVVVHFDIAGITPGSS
jgi:hypothetical protein